MSDPISPAAILEALPASEAAAKQATIDYINGILLLPDSIVTLAAGDNIPIWDSSNSPRFARTAPAVLKEYQTLGWVIKPGIKSNQWLFSLPPTVKP